MNIRTSTYQSSDAIRHYAKEKDVKTNQLMKQIGSNHQFENLGDNTIAATRASRYLSQLNRISQYSDQIIHVNERFQMAEGQMSRIMADLQELRRMAVQGSSGTYTKEDLQQIGRVSNELLHDLMSIANTKDEYGAAIFSGTKVMPTAYTSETGYVPGLNEVAITKVRYIGNNQERALEISDGKYIKATVPGSKLFWGQAQKIVSNINSENFMIMEKSSFSINNIQIPLEPGDNARTIISKINQSPVAINARISTSTKGIILEATEPSQIWLEEPRESKNLQELGLTNGSHAPENLHIQAEQSGASIFDIVIALRDSLLEGKHETVGGRCLSAIDASIANVSSIRTSFGARQERAHIFKNWLAEEKLHYTEMDAIERSVDISQAILELKELQNSQTASYMAAAKTMNMSLMDFLR